MHRQQQQQQQQGQRPEEQGGVHMLQGLLPQRQEKEAPRQEGGDQLQAGVPGEIARPRAGTERVLHLRGLSDEQSRE